MGDRSEVERALARAIRQLQMVVGALVFGPLAFFVVVLLIGPLPREEGAAREQRPFITYAAVLAGAAVLVTRGVVLRVMESGGRRRIAAGTYAPAGLASRAMDQSLAGAPGDAGRLFVLYQTIRIVGAAMIEGIALLAAVAYLLEGTTASLVLGAVFLALLVVTFPTAQKCVDWIVGDRRDSGALDP